MWDFLKQRSHDDLFLLPLMKNKCIEEKEWFDLKNMYQEITMYKICALHRYREHLTIFLVSITYILSTVPDKGLRLSRGYRK